MQDDNTWLEALSGKSQPSSDKGELKNAKDIGDRLRQTIEIKQPSKEQLEALYQRLEKENLLTSNKPSSSGYFTELKYAMAAVLALALAIPIYYFNKTPSFDGSYPAMQSFSEDKKQLVTTPPATAIPLKNVLTSLGLQSKVYKIEKTYFVEFTITELTAEMKTAFKENGIEVDHAGKHFIALPK